MSDGIDDFRDAVECGTLSNPNTVGLKYQVKSDFATVWSA